MVDGFADVAGGGSYRQKNGQRMRFKVFHKILDFKKRFGCHLCVGCGRCDAICPEYISFSHILNALSRVAAAPAEDPQRGAIHQ
jgi:anaerobic sulfite reductase subunit A